MLPKKRRLTKNRVDMIFKDGKTVHGHLLYLKYQTGGTPPSRVSVVVPKKNIKAAVDRNRMRRRIYGAVEKVIDVLPPNSHVVVVATNDVRSVGFDDLISEVKTLFKKV